MVVGVWPVFCSSFLGAHRDAAKPRGEERRPAETPTRFPRPVDLHFFRAIEIEEEDTRSNVVENSSRLFSLSQEVLNWF
jgi:hypothetical protein